MIIAAAARGYPAAMAAWDAIVIGAGPAGATAARRLAAGGARTLLLEKQRLPRYKACGGGVPARTEALLGLPIGEVSEGVVDTIEVSRFGSSWFRKRSAEPLASMVMRDRFDEWLADEAIAAGAELRDGCPAQGVALRSDGVEVETPGGRETARWLIAADGATGITARQCGFAVGGARSAAYELEVAAPQGALERWRGAANVDVGYRPWGYGWVFPKEGALSVGLVAAPGRGRHIRRQAGRYLGRLGLAEAEIEQVAGHPIRYRRSRSEPVAQGAALLLGDAAGLADEFTAEGIAYAAHSANLAAAAILGGGDAAAAYGAAVDREIQPELDAARTISRLYYFCVTSWPWLARQASNAVNYLWRAFFRVMRGENTYAAELGRLPGGGAAQRLLAAG